MADARFLAFCCVQNSGVSRITFSNLLKQFSNGESQADDTGSCFKGNAPMKRYFFDVVGHNRSELDYVGRMLPTAEEAYEPAEMIAFDLAVSVDELVGSEVAVSDIHGRKLFSILVKESYLTALPAELGVGETLYRTGEAAASFDAVHWRARLDCKTHKMAA
jgi:hypothetical protein